MHPSHFCPWFRSTRWRFGLTLPVPKEGCLRTCRRKVKSQSPRHAQHVVPRQILEPFVSLVFTLQFDCQQMAFCQCCLETMLFGKTVKFRFSSWINRYQFHPKCFDMFTCKTLGDLWSATIPLVTCVVMAQMAKLLGAFVNKNVDVLCYSLRSSTFGKTPSPSPVFSEPNEEVGLSNQPVLRC